MDLTSIFHFKKSHEALKILEKRLCCKQCNEFCNNPRRHSDCGNLLCSCYAAECGTCPHCGRMYSSANTSPDWHINNIIEATKKIKALITKKSTQEEEITNTKPHEEDKTNTKLSPNEKEREGTSKDNQNNVNINGHAKDSSGKGLKDQQSKRIVKKSKTNARGYDNYPSKSSNRPSNDAKKGIQTDIFTDKVKKEEIKDLAIIKSIMKRNTKGETRLHSACVKGDKKKVEEFLAAGADPCTKDNAGWTPLHEAVSKGNIDVVRLLLGAGAMVNVPGGYNNTPLHDAVLGNHLEIAQLLITFGADPELKNIEGFTPRSMAQSEEMISLLKECKPLHPVCAKERKNFFQKDIVLYGLNLPHKDQDRLNIIAQRLKIKLCASLHFDVTHIVVTTKKGCCTPNLDILCGILKGKWIVDAEWLQSCLDSCKMVDPTEFEVTGTNSFPDSSAPMKSRLNTEKMQPSLFNGIHFYFSGVDKVMYNDTKLTKAQLCMLVTSGDGQVLSREPNPEAIPSHDSTFPYHGRNGPFEKCSHIIIYQPGRNEPLLKYNMNHVKSLPVSWFLNSIETFELIKP